MLTIAVDAEANASIFELAVRREQSVSPMRPAAVRYHGTAKIACRMH